MQLADRQLFPSVSVGITLNHDTHESAEDLLREAHVAVHRAKQGGRHRFEIFDAALHQQVVHQLDLEGELRNALQNGEFEPYFQPIVRLEDGGIVGHESLLRWHHPRRGLLAPGAFLAVAEESGCIAQIDWQIFERTCAMLACQPQGGAYYTINVSPQHFRSPKLARRLLEMIARHGVAPQRLRVEITESAVLEDPDLVLRTLNDLREAGVLAVLDDFGTGYSSLSYLHRFPLRCIKIDRSFVEAMRSGQEGGSEAVIRAVLAMSSALDMDVIAEGIETRQQQDALLALGCPYGQGFLFSPPRPASGREE